MAVKQQSLVERFERELECGICLKRLKDPKVLPCLHTFCRGCLTILVRKQQTDSTISCPICCETHPLPVGGVRNLQTNFILNNLLELLEVYQATNKTCENGLDDNNATARCLECNIYLCEHCLNIHKRMVITRRHKTASLEELKDADEIETHLRELNRPHYCSEHEDKLLRLFCKTCSKVICDDCMYVEHRYHDYAFIKNVQDELRGSLETVTSDLLQHEKGLKTQVESLDKLGQEQAAMVETCKKNITREATAMRKKINDEEAVALKAANSVLANRQKEITLHANAVSESLLKVSRLVMFMQRLLRSGSDVEIASAAPQAIERSKRTGQLQEIPVMVFPKIDYCVNKQTECKLYITNADVNLRVKGFDNIGLGWNRLHLTTNVTCRPTIQKLVFIPAQLGTTSEPVQYSMSATDSTQREWVVDFQLHNEGSIKLHVTLGTAEFQTIVQIGSTII